MALSIELTTVTGRWLRHIPAGADPAVRPAAAGDNRWQRGSIVDALYLCDQTACVWAEWYRHLAELAIPPQMALPRDLWTYTVTDLHVADLRSPEQLAAIGLPVPRPGRQSWQPFQAVGERLYADGYAGLLAPSAARPQSVVLCVFLPDTALPASVVGRPPPERVERAPAPPTGMRT
ncbi:MAG: RES family NAD+ phosphorylase [Solirubrobacteraceae bacterium]